MKTFEVYFGKTYIECEKIEELELLVSFNSMDDAEKFVFKHIHEYRKSVYYIRIVKGETMRWYDYGSYTKFYVIKAVHKKSK